MTPALISALIGAAVAVTALGAWLFKSGRTWNRIESGIDTLRADMVDIKQATSVNSREIGDLKTETAVHKVEIAALKAIASHFSNPTIINNNPQNGAQS